MKFNDTILSKYLNEIDSGKILVGQELYLELQNLKNDIETGKYIFDTKQTDYIFNFLEGCIRLTKSPFFGKPLKLMLWQKAFIESFFSFKMKDGTDRFQRALLMLARKNGKSEICSALGLMELLIGGHGLDIVCSSNDDMQANILYQAINTMRLQIDPQQEATWINQQGIKCLYNNNKIFKLSDRTRNKEGRNIDFAIVDEIHEMKTKDIIKAIEQSQSLKINPKLVLITTEGFVNNGVLDEELQRARQIINKQVDDRASERMLPFLYTQDDENEIWQGDRENRLWEKSNPSLGVIKKYEYLETQVDLAKTNKTDRTFVLCKDFNIHQNTSESWLRRETYIDIQPVDFSQLRGELMVGGVDIAETTDLTCASLLVVKNGIKHIKTMYWLPKRKLEADTDISSGAKYKEWVDNGLMRVVDGNFMRPSLITDWIVEIVKTYELKPFKIGYDVRFANEFIENCDNWGIETDLILQKPYVMSNPISMLEADLETKQIKGLSEVDKWCFGNATLVVNNQGFGILDKIRGNKNFKIDGAVATAIAYEEYRRNMEILNPQP